MSKQSDVGALGSRGLRPVVGAAIVDSLSTPTLLLAAKRSYPEELRGLFELPGGKVERGELPSDALRREIYEELGVHLELGSPVPGPGNDTEGYDFAPWPILQGRAMWVWLAQIQPGEEPRPSGSHSALTWVNREGALELPWLPADVPIARAVALRMKNAG